MTRNDTRNARNASTALNAVTMKTGAAAANADFDHPLDMLTACHERIAAQCATLQRLAGHLPHHGSDAQAQQAASNVMRYFDSAGRHHREDEETDLFPSLMAAAKGEQAARVALLVEQLTREHADIERCWLALRDALETVAHGEDALLDAMQVDRFCAMYRDHMAAEEAHVIPLAASVLGAGTLRSLGGAMARRRCVKP